MSLHESDDSPVSYIRSHRSDLPKVGSKLKKILFSDDRCHGDAQRLNEYWKGKPDEDILAISYDENQKQFVLTHRVDGDLTISPERFYALVAKKAVQILSGEVSQKIKNFMGSNE